MKQAVICEPIRTPVGKYGGVFKDVPATALAETVLRELVRRKVRDLRVIGVVGGDLNIDFLVGAGAVSVVDTCSVTMGEFARTGPNFARHVLGARVRALDNT
jgi:acetyl-CoA acetyltransferase